MRAIVLRQLSVDLNCKIDDFDKEDIIFCASKENPGRRLFSRDKTHFTMLSAGKSAIVSASNDIMPFLREQLTEKTPKEAFRMPFVCGIGLFFLPDLDIIKPLSPIDVYEYVLFEKSDMPCLYEFEGFGNALQYDIKSPRPDCLAIAARHEGKIIAVASASDDCRDMWQISVEVASEHRGKGLASYLTNALTFEIMNRGYVPYCCVSTHNIHSQRAAHRAGYEICWTSSRSGIFEGKYTKPVY